VRGATHLPPPQTPVAYCGKTPLLHPERKSLFANAAVPRMTVAEDSLFGSSDHAACRKAEVFLLDRAAIAGFVRERIQSFRSPRLAGSADRGTVGGNCAGASCHAN